MKRRWLMLVIVFNLLVLVGLAFVYPNLMISPGRLTRSHAALATDCFACHAPLRGPTANRCVACHAVADIGRLTTTGVPMTGKADRLPFHQALTRKDCMACHTDPAGVKLTQPLHPVFSHALLDADIRQRCASCHASPATPLHRQVGNRCAQCHTPEHWKPAAFKHASLAADRRQQCATCHTPPKNALHRQISGNCQQCHGTTQWKPATFDHDPYFPLVGHHKARCATCHVQHDFSRYTCFGCHEHTPARIEAKHREEGIRDTTNCVKCHRRGASEHQRDD
jgi:hypothetical protein